MNVIGDASNAVCLAPTIPAHGRQIRVNSGPDRGIQQQFSVFGAEDKVDNDLAQGLGHRIGLD